MDAKGNRNDRYTLGKAAPRNLNKHQVVGLAEQQVTKYNAHKRKGKNRKNLHHCEDRAVETQLLDSTVTIPKRWLRERNGGHTDKAKWKNSIWKTTFKTHNCDFKVSHLYAAVWDGQAAWCGRIAFLAPKPLPPKSPVKARLCTPEIITGFSRAYL